MLVTELTSLCLNNQAKTPSLTRSSGLMLCFISLMWTTVLDKVSLNWEREGGGSLLLLLLLPDKSPTIQQCLCSSGRTEGGREVKEMKWTHAVNSFQTETGAHAAPNLLQTFSLCHRCVPSHSPLMTLSFSIVFLFHFPPSVLVSASVLLLVSKHCAKRWY